MRVGLVLQQYFTSVMKLHPSQGVLRIGLHLNPPPPPKPPPPPNETYLPTPAESIVQPGLFKVEGLVVFPYRRDCESHISANSSSSPATVCTCEVSSLTSCIYTVIVWDRIPVQTRFFARPDRPWGPPNLLYNGYRVFPGGKVRPGRAADHSLPSSVAVMEQ